MSTLTPRQEAALRLAAQGLGDKEIGQRLGITIWGARQLLRFTYARLGVPGRTDAFRAMGWLVVPPEVETNDYIAPNISTDSVDIRAEVGGQPASNQPEQWTHHGSSSSTLAGSTPQFGGIR